MHLLKKYRLELIFFVLAISVFFSTRLFNILSLPMFTDEAIYTRWSQIARQDPAWRFISLTDGKQPMFVWFDMFFMKFIKDPLLSGRLVSVAAGLGSMIGLYFLGKEIFKNRTVGFFSSLLYLIYPFALVYDRMALYDSLVGMFAVWSLYFEVLLVRNIRLDLAFILALVLGGSVLTKTSGFFGIYLLPFSLLIFDFRNKQKFSRLFRWIILALIAVLLANLYYLVLRLSPFFGIIESKNATFVYPFYEWLQHPFTFFWGNLLGLWDWFLVYTGWPIIILMFMSLFFIKSFFKEKILLIIWFIVPFCLLALFGKVLYPRFILFMTLPLLTLAAFSLTKLNLLFKKKIFIIFCILIIIALPLRADYFVLSDFSNAPIPFSDKGQYINGWPAGGGLKEIVSYLDNESQKGKIYVASEGTFGSLPTWGIEIYLGENKNIEKQGIWPLPSKFPKDLADKSKIMPVYFILNQTQEKPLGWPVTLISKYRKGISDVYMSLYKVSP